MKRSIVISRRFPADPRRLRHGKRLEFSKEFSDPRILESE